MAKAVRFKSCDRFAITVKALAGERCRIERVLSAEGQQTAIEYGETKVADPSVDIVCAVFTDQCDGRGSGEQPNQASAAENHGSKDGCASENLSLDLSESIKRCMANIPYQDS